MKKLACNNRAKSGRNPFLLESRPLSAYKLEDNIILRHNSPVCYNRQMSEWTKRWPHFAPEEVLSRGSQARDICPYSLDRLEELRVLAGVPLLVNHGKLQLRGVRTVEENQTIPIHARGSFHIKGRAFDVTPVGLTISALLEIVLAEHLFSGIGVYSSWLHLDTRYLSPGEPPTIWTG